MGRSIDKTAFGQRTSAQFRLNIYAGNSMSKRFFAWLIFSVAFFLAVSILLFLLNVPAIFNLIFGLLWGVMMTRSYSKLLKIYWTSDGRQDEDKNKPR